MLTVKADLCKTRYSSLRKRARALAVTVLEAVTSEPRHPIAIGLDPKRFATERRFISAKARSPLPSTTSDPSQYFFTSDTNPHNKCQISRSDG
jgi:hypothetical protein